MNHTAATTPALAQFVLGVPSGFVHFAIVVVILVAIWILVDHFVTDGTIKLVLKVVGGALLIILAIRLLAGLAGI